MLASRSLLLPSLAVPAAILGIAGLARAQSTPATTHGLVCPLSDSQTQKAIDAFAKLVPTFTQEPRCVNCHGGVDPFANPTSHGGGTVDPVADCDTCHSEMPAKTGGQASKWRLANREHFFLGKNAPTLCKQMKSAFQKGSQFIGHLIDDNGNSKFTEVAFLGTRGLNEAGRDLVDNYKAAPPSKITHGGLIDFGQKWIDAMGGEFQGDESCGCEPAHYAIRISDDTRISFLMAHGETVIAPTDIPITFHDDGTFEGQATMQMQGNSVAGWMPVCYGQSSASIVLKASGQAKEQWDESRMTLRIENVSPVSGRGSATCPSVPASASAPMNGQTQHRMLDFEMQGRVDESGLYTILLPMNVGQAQIRAQIVKLP